MSAEAGEVMPVDIENQGERTRGPRLVKLDPERGIPIKGKMDEVAVLARTTRRGGSAACGPCLGPFAERAGREQRIVGPVKAPTRLRTLSARMYLRPGCGTASLEHTPVVDLGQLD